MGQIYLPGPWRSRDPILYYHIPFIVKSPNLVTFSHRRRHSVNIHKTLEMNSVLRIRRKLTRLPFFSYRSLEEKTHLEITDYIKICQNERHRGKNEKYNLMITIQQSDTL
ncbi:hypothetical protein GDO81_020909 [Engystomops pustulosus]|uniref:Uncharacterized protein n=1 Tax=Engystomops pustulosus TaxID=76066 RepID=A0AAV6ZDG3_ENGPU|nr:hypothetical protein GDO81_020909 [Engystomops pustulosus]